MSLLSVNDTINSENSVIDQSQDITEDSRSLYFENMLGNDVKEYYQRTRLELQDGAKKSTMPHKSVRLFTKKNNSRQTLCVVV